MNLAAVIACILDGPAGYPGSLGTIAAGSILYTRSFRRGFGLAFVVVQNAVGRRVQVVELSGAGGTHEGPDRGDAERKGEREQNVDHRHGGALSGESNVRIHSAMPSTVNEATGIRMAACKALTTPATARLAAMAL